MQLVDSCWHAATNPSAMEWWYFTLLCDDGQVLRGRLWVRGDERRSLRCGVDTTLYPAEGDQPIVDVREVYGSGAFHAERSRLLVMVEASSVRERGGGFELALRSEELLLEVEARPCAQERNIVVRQPVSAEHGFVWTVPLLKGAFEGRLAVGRQAEPQRISGTIFLDHVLADVAPTVDMLRNYRGWTWAVAYLPDRSILSLQVDFRRAPLDLAFTLSAEGQVTRHAAPDLLPLRREAGGPARFVLARDGGRPQPVRVGRLFQRPHTTLGGRLTERLLNALPTLHKVHGVGDAGGGPSSFYFETLRLL